MIDELTKEQQQLLFDFAIGITSDDDSAKAALLIASNSDAARLVKKIKTFFSPLDIAHQDDCPEHLVEKTIEILKKAAASNTTSQSAPQPVKLQELITAEQAKQELPVASYVLRTFGKLLAAAAVIFIVAGTYLSATGYMRQKSWQAACQAQLMNIGRGYASYQNANNGQMPKVAMAEGSPWWMVGYKPESTENQSNTRHMYLLVRTGYLKPDDFICPGSNSAAAYQRQSVQPGQLCDFPARQYVTYSFRLCCSNNGNTPAAGKTILIADMNPLFEQLPKEFKQLRLQLNEKMKKMNSINHNRRGQNILFTDGSVDFVKTRYAGTANDDIFTLQNINLYKGNETPQTSADDFVAP